MRRRPGVHGELPDHHDGNDQRGESQEAQLPIRQIHCRKPRRRNLQSLQSALADLATQVVTFGVRFHREELAELHTIATENGLPVGTVIRQMVRHYLSERRKGQAAPIDLGAIQWRVKIEN